MRLTGPIIDRRRNYRHRGTDEYKILPKKNDGPARDGRHLVISVPNRFVLVCVHYTGPVYAHPRLIE